MRRRFHPPGLLLVGVIGMCGAVANACGGGPATDENESNSGGATGDGDGTGASGGDGDGDDASGGTGGNETSTGGDSSAGGGMPMGGSSGQLLVTLGDECSSPGTFACAENNPKLALICGSGAEWEARETCSGESLCDFNSGPDEGTCRVPLEDCEEAGVDPLCVGNDVGVCNAGGFDTTIVEECTDSCEDGACVWMADACIADSDDLELSNCAGDECEGETDSSCFDGALGTQSCDNMQWLGPVAEDRVSVVRLPVTELCNIGTCEREVYFAVVTSDGAPDQPLRLRVGPGWGMIPYDGEETWQPCAEWTEGCLIIPPKPVDNERGALLFPVSEATVTRNLTIEVVEPGTTCD